MILEKTIIGALVGGIAGLIGYSLANKLKLNKNHLSIITLSLAISTSMIASKIADPYLQKMHLKEQLHRDLISRDKMPIFKILKETDPVEFEKVIDEMSGVVLKNKNVSEEELELLMYRFGSEVVSKYYQNASSESIRAYIESLIQFMEELYNISPANVCKLISPDRFGVLNLDDLKNIKSQSKMVESLRPIILSAKKKEGNWTKEVAYILLNSNREKFLSKNSRIKEIINTASKDSSEKDKELLARGIIDMYKYFFSLKREESDLIFRAILSGE